MDNKATSSQYHYIYLTCDLKYKKWYCGKRSTDKEINKDYYFGSGIIIKQIIKKYDKEEINKRFKKIILHETKSYEENCIMEKFYIDDVFDAPNNPYFYNIANGGYGGNLIKGKTKEEKRLIYKKIGKANKGRILSNETKEKISKNGKGLSRTEETKNKISKSKMGEKNSFFNKKHKELSKQKISEKTKDENNPRARYIIVLDKVGNIIFRDIRKSVFRWALDNNICSESTIKKLLKKKKIFTPIYNNNKYFNAHNYIGIKFLYEDSSIGEISQETLKHYIENQG